jgi:hypothetical protein
MSRAFVKEDAEVREELPDRRISTHPNDVRSKAWRTCRPCSIRRERLMPPRWLHKTVSLWRKQPVNCAIGALVVSARVIPDPTDAQEVRGSSVSIRRADGREQAFRIVGEDEADPARGTISHVAASAVAHRKMCR